MTNAPDDEIRGAGGNSDNYTASEFTRRVDLVITNDAPAIRWRTLRIRRWARREFDRLHGIDPWQCAEPAGNGHLLDPWHDNHMHLGVRERDLLGADLAAAGWSAC